MTTQFKKKGDHSASHLLMVRPAHFDFNPQTAVNNVFQKADAESGVEEAARREFDDFVSNLRSKGVDVMVFNDSNEPRKPDAVFPNNWISMHANGSVCLYPMYAPNRRLERDANIVTQISERFKVRKLIDFTHHEKQGQYLEGTGSMVLDRENHIAYACLSERTDARVLKEFCEKLRYKAVTFTAQDENGMAVYHTNVMLCVAKTFAVACLESVRDDNEVRYLKSTLEDTGKEVIPISLGQMREFAGNMLQVSDKNGRDILVMSSRAHASLTGEQLSRIERHCEVLHSPLDTIETHGGGSARCMMAEIFLRERSLWFQV